MTENQDFKDRVTAVYVSFQTRHGFGESYESKVVPQFGHRFTFKNLRIGDEELSVGILHQKNLTTVIFCKDTDAFRYTTESTITYTLYGGKLAPKGQSKFYPSVMKCIHNREKEWVIRPLMISEIIPYLGQLASGVTVSKDLHKESVLQFFFNAEGQIKKIKKGV
jgi:hypothetical protein